MDKNIEKVFSPVSNVIKKNSKIINLALVILVCLMVFPTEYFLTIDPVKEIEGQLSKLLQNPFVMAVVTLLVYVVWITNDPTMFVLVMFLVHRLSSHQVSAPSRNLIPVPNEDSDDSTPPTPKKAPGAPLSPFNKYLSIMKCDISNK